MKSLNQDSRVDFTVDPSMYIEGNYSAPDSIYSDLNKVVKIDLHYRFSGPIGASYWITLCRLPEYGHLELVSFCLETLFGSPRSPEGARRQ